MTLKKLGKRGLALLVALLMCVTMLPVSTLAVEGYEEVLPGTVESTEGIPGQDGNSGEGVIPGEGENHDEGETPSQPEEGGEEAPGEGETQYVASIGETGYETLQAAITAAENNAVVVLQKDVAETVTFRDKAVALDLNGYTVDGQGEGTVLTINGGSVTLMDSVGTGAITGGANSKHGGGVKVDGNAAFVMEGGAITGNSATEWGGGVCVDYGTFTMDGGTISKNTAKNNGGGVAVYNYTVGDGKRAAAFIMNDGEISGNSSNTGGGIGAYGSYKSDEGFNVICIHGGKIIGNTGANGGGIAISTVKELSGEGAEEPNCLVVDGEVVISGNTANMGGGVYSADSTTTISGSTITGNEAAGPQGFGGGVYVQGGSADLTGAEVIGNSAAYGGGVYAGKKLENTTVTMTSGKLYGNIATVRITDVFTNELTTLTLPQAADMGGTLNGKPVTGWYWDGGGEYNWSPDYCKLQTSFSARKEYRLVAAYGWYTVTFNSNGGSDVEPQTIAEGDTVEMPANPTRSGYTFAGWQLEGAAYDFAAPVTGSITLVGQWRQNSTPTPPTPVNPNPPVSRYTVRYTDGVEDEEVFADRVFSGLAAGTATPDFGLEPEREGYTFLGWEPEVAPRVTGNAIYVAQWEEDEIIDEGDVPLVVAPGLDVVNHYGYIIGYGDGTVRPQNNITRAEIVTIFYRMMEDSYRETFWTQSNGFNDVNSGDWYNNAASVCANAELINGYADGSFQGKKNITRAEFAAIAARFNPAVDTEMVEDYPDTVGHWAQDAIRTVTAAGWFMGDNCGFRPNDLITRAEAMTAVNRMLGRVPSKENLHEDMQTFPDNSDPDAWYYAAVQEATNSHEYEREQRDDESVETWTEMKEKRNWAALEKEWSDAYSGSNGTEVTE